MFIQALSGSIYRGSEGERVAGGEWLTGGENVKKGCAQGSSPVQKAPLQGSRSSIG